MLSSSRSFRHINTRLITAILHYAIRSGVTVVHTHHLRVQGRYQSNAQFNDHAVVLIVVDCRAWQSFGMTEGKLVCKEITEAVSTLNTRLITVKLN